MIGRLDGRFADCQRAQAANDQPHRLRGPRIGELQLCEGASEPPTRLRRSLLGSLLRRGLSEVRVVVSSTVAALAEPVKAEVHKTHSSAPAGTVSLALGHQASLRAGRFRFGAVSGSREATIPIRITHNVSKPSGGTEPLLQRLPPQLSSSSPRELLHSAKRYTGAVRARLCLSHAGNFRVENFRMSESRWRLPLISTSSANHSM